MMHTVWCHMRRNLMATVVLLPLLLVSLLLTSALFAGQGGVSASQVFQSPVQPPPAPTQPKLPPKVPAPPKVPKPTQNQPPALTPTPTQPQKAAPSAPAPTQPAPAATRTQQPAQPTATTQPTSRRPEAATAAKPKPEPVIPDENEVVVDSGLLIDSILVYISYVWLCCGVIAFISIPIIFLALYVWGSQQSKKSSG
jgi:hypothetical protein